MSDEQPKRVKGGRPRKHSPNAKRPTMAFRINSGLHEQLIAAASASERSLSEEIERRLERSFDDERIRQIVRDEMAAVILPIRVGDAPSRDERGPDRLFKN